MQTYPILKETDIALENVNGEIASWAVLNLKVNVVAATSQTTAR